MQKLLALVAMIAALVMHAPSAYAQSSRATEPKNASVAYGQTHQSKGVSYGMSHVFPILAMRFVAQTDTRGLAEPTPTATPKPTVTPTPARAPHVASVTSVAPAGSLNADLLFDMSNAHRAGLGLPAFIKDERLCELARSRAPEIHAEVYGGYMHQGLTDRNISFWITENIVTMATEAQAFDWWSHHGIHKAALESGNTHSCVACHGIACAQEFTSWTPK